MCIEPSVYFYKIKQKKIVSWNDLAYLSFKICKLFAAVASFDLEQCCNRPAYEELTRLTVLTFSCLERNENNT